MWSLRRVPRWSTRSELFFERLAESPDCPAARRRGLRRAQGFEHSCLLESTA